MFWLRNKKNNLQLRTLIWGPGYNVTHAFTKKLLSGGNLFKYIVTVWDLVGINCMCKNYWLMPPSHFHDQGHDWYHGLNRGLIAALV